MQNILDVFDIDTCFANDIERYYMRDHACDVIGGIEEVYGYKQQCYVNKTDCERLYTANFQGDEAQIWFQYRHTGQLPQKHLRVAAGIRPR